MNASSNGVATGGAGIRLYQRARQLIPGGTQLLSKRPEMFLPEQWPAYYQRAKGCRVEDLDGRTFIDMTSCGIGSCPLGFADDYVNDAVKCAVDAGTMCTLNSPREVELAELFLQIHPWAQMVRYARTGGEAVAMAVRIARAATGRDTIAFCGYHGWHDWYLAANLAEDDSLDGHLLPGLQPAGVPRTLRGTAIPFQFGRIDQFRALVAEHGGRLAAVVMEPMRFDLPPEGFLEEIRRLTQHCGAALIFDEITSGWRHHFGGIHLKLGAHPDIVVYAKSISNGYPMAAVIGRRELMEAAQKTFISSTYWTETIGPTAALATIRRMREIDLPSLTHRAGTRLMQGWRDMAKHYQLPAQCKGLPALLHLSFNAGEPEMNIALQTLLTQEMLDRGFLAGAAFYPTAAHGDAVIDQYLQALKEVFPRLKEALDQGSVLQRLRGPVAHTGFRRLT